MKERKDTTWIEQRTRELEENIAAWKIEMQGRRAAGTGPDPEALAKIKKWEEEFRGLKSLRDSEGGSEGL